MYYMHNFCDLHVYNIALKSLILKAMSGQLNVVQISITIKPYMILGENGQIERGPKEFIMLMGLILF